MSFRLAQRLPKDVLTPSCRRLKDILMTSLTCLPIVGFELQTSEFLAQYPNHYATLSSTALSKGSPGRTS
ncbi:hypothetical protein OUZ56_016572 [Daphnia magna]|uniref:Uncharacterized protein n=1 Tax=Daphnia magna TaxID=35525 RepID=A0ABQ9ZE52_9CRUS|nr:hypothetical protein OUZ56_020304 [Daphnia magna]KAK4027527.1 hypothetical protein OUZ56_016572 [Daphnia magna]